MATSPGMANNDQVSMPADLVEVGKVLSAHGVRGWFKVQAYSSSAQALRHSNIWWLSSAADSFGRPLPRATQPFKILARRQTLPGQMLVQAEQLLDRTAADALRGHLIWLPRAGFPPAEPDEYYWVDLIGCTIYGLDAEGRIELGQVVHIFDNGAHPVLQVLCGQTDHATGRFISATDSRGRGRHQLIPFVAAHVLAVDLQHRQIDSNWPAGF